MRLINLRTVFVLFFGLCFSIRAEAQVTNHHITNGNHDFKSSYPEQNLYFYLFDDGYHSFEVEPYHQYHVDHVGAQPKVYTTEPYGSHDPTGTNAGNVISDGTNQIPTNPDADMSNMIQIKRSWNLRDGSQNYFVILFKNLDKTNSISGCVEFHYQSQNSDIVASDDILDSYNNWVHSRTHSTSPYTQEGMSHMYKWHFDDLEPMEERYIYVRATCLEQMNNFVKTAAVLHVSNNDCTTVVPWNENDKQNGQGNGNSNSIGTDPIYVLNSQVMAYAHDPNCMISYCTERFFQYDDGPIIDYRIYFQNDGENYANYVRIDTKPNTPMKNVRLLDASHSCSLNWSANQIRVEYQNINLPSTQMHYPVEQTIGWVDVRVCYKYVVDCFDQIGGIVFDQQEPIAIRNQVCTGLSEPCNVYGHLESPTIFQYGVDCQTSLMTQNLFIEVNPFEGSNKDIATPRSHIGTDDEIRIFPNPASERLTLRFPKTMIDSSLKTGIYDMQGSLIKEFDFNQGTNEIGLDISFLPQGAYFVKVQNYLTRAVKTFIKS